MAELWYYTSEGKQMEPVTQAELRQLASTGFLQQSDLVWKEGMANWVKAATVAGLFAAAPATAPAAPSAAPGAAASGAPREAPVRRRPARLERDDDLDEDASDEDRPRRRRRAPSGSGMGIVLAVVGAGVLLVVVVLGLTLYIAVRGGGQKAGNFATYSADLPPRGFFARDFDFQAGKPYEFRVTSDRNTDVDLHIEQINGGDLAADTSIGPNSYLFWTPPAAGKYRVRIENLDEDTPNRSHVSIDELAPGAVPRAPAPGNPIVFAPRRPRNGVNQMPRMPANAPPVLAGPNTRSQGLPMLQPGQDSVVSVVYPAAKQVEAIVVTVQQECDVDLFVEEVGGGQVAADIRVSPHCRVLFQAQAGRTYNFRVRNLGPGPAQSTLSYTGP